MRDNGHTIVTGGANGIGAAITLKLLSDGRCVTMLDIDAASGERMLRDCSAFGSSLLFVPTDITDYASVTDAVDAAERNFGPIKGLVNNAGWDRARRFVDTDPAFWQRVIDINLYGPIHLLHSVLPKMVKQQAGKIVSIASDAGRVGSSGEAVYSACKGGLIAMMKSLAREHARDKISLNTICPGPTDTAILQSFFEGEEGTRLAERLKKSIPMRRVGQPDDYIGLASFLLGSGADFMTGQTISISGGLTMHG